MKQPKIISLLQTFSPWELRGLHDMLESPALNKQRIVVDLFLFVKDRLLSSKQLELDEVSMHLFPGEAFDHQRIRYLLSDLTRLAEEYLVQRQLDAEPLLREQLLSQALRERNLDKFHLQTLRRASQKIDRSPLEDSRRHYLEFRIKEAALGSNSSRKKAEQTQNIRETLESLEKFSLATRLKYMCEMVNRQNVVAGDDDLQPARQLSAELDQSEFRHLPAISIYHRILRTLLESEQESHYRDLRALIRKHFRAFEREELGQQYAFALNYCMKKLNSGRTEYLRELFGLYQELIEGRILHHGGHLPPRHFKNIVTTAIRVEEFDWAEQFIEQYQADLPPDERENAALYNRAALAYAMGDYSRTLKLLQQVEFTDVFYQLDSKSLLLKSYYELDEFEPLLSLIDAFKLYLKRNKVLSDYQRRVYLNLVKFVRSLVRIRLGSRKSIAQLRQEVEANREVADLRWLLGKIGEVGEGR